MRHASPSFRFVFAALGLFGSLFAHAQPMDSAAVAKVIDSLTQLNKQLIGQQKFDESLRVVEEAKHIAEQTFGNNSIHYAIPLLHHGITLYHKRRYLESEALFLESEKLIGRIYGKEHFNYILCLYYLAVTNYYLGRYEPAEYDYLECLSLVKKTIGEENQFYPAVLTGLAAMYVGIGNYESAEPLFLKAKASWQKLLGKEHPLYATSVFNLASLYGSMGHYEAAEALFLEAKAIQEKLLGKEHLNYGQTIDELAGLYKNLGIYEAALHLYLESKAIQERILGRENSKYATTLTGIAGVYEEMGFIKDAEALHLEAIKVWEKSLGKEHPHYAAGLLNLGLVYFETKQYKEAESLFIEAKNIWERTLGKEHPYYAASITDIANLYTKIGNVGPAEVFFLEAINIWETKLGKKHIDCIKALQGIAELYSNTGKAKSALSYYIESTQLQQELLSESFNYLSEAELFQYIISFTAGQDHFFSFVQSSAITETDVLTSAYDNTLFYKGFLLTAANQIKQLALSDSVTTEKFNFLKSYQRRLAAEYTKPIAERKNVPELEEKANTIEKDLARSVSGYGESMRQVRWKEVQQALKPGEAAIEFVHFRYYGKKETDSIMYAALLLRPGDEQPIYLPLCEAQQLQAHIEAQRQMSINNLYAYHGEGSPSLYRLLWLPLDPLLKDVNTVYYSPSGELHRLNLDAIGEPLGAVLGDHYNLKLLMSTRQLISTTPLSLIAGDNALVFGGIEYNADSTAIYDANGKIGAVARDTTGGYFKYADRSRGNFSGTWEYLAASQKEAEEIQQTLKSEGIQTTLRQGVEATEEVFKQVGVNAPSPALLHLATHGYFFPDPEEENEGRGIKDDEPIFKLSEHPLIRSGLILAGANHAWRTGYPYKGAEDGILTAYEVSQMDLSNTELVVLSACETGLGDIKGHEGVYGLQRAFRIAGAKYILMSLWKVPNEPARQLMTSFYRYWLKDKMELEDAFRKAQSELRSKYSDPEMWAGFVMIKG